MVSAQQLSEFELFEGLSVEQLETVADLCEEVTCSRGEMLFWEGDEAGLLYILLEGKIHISLQLSSRPERVTMSIIGEHGQPFGWSGVVAPHYYTASALCESDCRALAINGQELLQVLAQDPTMGFVVIQRVAEVISTRLRNTRSALLKTM